MPAVEPSEALVLETSDRKFRYIGGCIVIVVFVFFGMWSVFAPLNSAALAPGVIKVEGNRKTIQHLEGGIVQSIFVEDGSKVKKGDILLELDDTQLKVELKIVYGQLYIALAEKAGLMAERDDREIITFDNDLLESPLTEEIISGEKLRFEFGREARLGEIKILQRGSEQLRHQAAGLKALIDSKTLLIKSYEEDVVSLRKLLTKGYVDKGRLRELLRQQEEFSGEVTEHTAAIAGIKVKISETELKILQLTKNFKVEVVEKLSVAQSVVYDLYEKITALEDRVARSRIRSPDTGVVMGLSLHTIGGVVGSGEPLMDIVPEGARLIVEAQLSTADIDRVSLGMTADIRFSAFNSATTPLIEGTLVSLSADRLLDEQTGQPYYLAKLIVNDEGIRLLDGLDLLPGMSAEVLIKTGARTLFEYLAKPAKNAFSRAMIEE